jgi:hypothetical protein
MIVLAKAFLSLVIAGIALFCVFGFLATFEYTAPSARLPWQIGYALLFVACLTGLARLLLRQKR